MRLEECLERIFPVDAEAGKRVQERLNAVSYTHLDVYKRQVYIPRNGNGYGTSGLAGHKDVPGRDKI